MNTFSRRFTATTCALFFVAASAVQAAPNAYDVTGPVISINDTMIVVEKGGHNWEVARDANTKGAENIKVGDKVTVHYVMTASSIEVKPAKAAGAGKKAKPEAAPVAPTATAAPKA